MALIKMVRSEPRVAGGNKEGMFDEALVADLKKLGWKPADKDSDKKSDAPKADDKKSDSDKPKAEPVKDAPKADEKKDKVEEPSKK